MFGLPDIPKKFISLFLAHTSESKPSQRAWKIIFALNIHGTIQFSLKKAEFKRDLKPKL